MSSNPFDDTRKYIETHPDFIERLAIFVSHDPITGKRAAHPLFISGNRTWIVEKKLTNSAFKDSYLAEMFDTKDKSVIAITKGKVPRKSGELAIAEKLMESPIKGVVEILDLFDMGGGEKAIRYRYYSGGDLLTRIKNNPLSLLEKKVVAKCIIEGVAGLHEAGILHRDIKPANVLLELDDHGQVKGAILSDFGEGTLLEDPHSIHNIEHQHSPSEGNEAMEKHSDALAKWYEMERERKSFDDEELPEDFQSYKENIEKAVQPLIEDLRKITIAESYDAWGLGLCLWCLFFNKQEKNFPWYNAANNTEYGEIAKLKKEFSESNPGDTLPKPYKEIVNALLNHNREKRISAHDALSKCID